MPSGFNRRQIAIDRVQVRGIDQFGIEPWAEFASPLAPEADATLGPGNPGRDGRLG